jgi:hypothetical protein
MFRRQRYVANCAPLGSALGLGIKKISLRSVIVTVPIARGSGTGFMMPVSLSEATSYRSTLVSMAFELLVSSSILNVGGIDVLRHKKGVEKNVNPLVQTLEEHRGVSISVEMMLMICARGGYMFRRPSAPLLRRFLLDTRHFSLSSSSSPGSHHNQQIVGVFWALTW